MWIPPLRTAATRLGEFVARAPDGSPVKAVLGPAQLRFGGNFKTAEVVRVVDTLESSEINFWVAGGWGVEALAGRQSRTHHDLDVVIDDFANCVDAASEALAPAGYHLLDVRSLAVWMPDRLRLQHDELRCTIDLLSIDWARLAEGLGVAARRTGRRSELFDAIAFTRGSLNGMSIPCLSAAVQLLFHSGFPLRPEHKHDVALVRSLLDSIEIGVVTAPGTRNGAAFDFSREGAPPATRRRC